MGIVSLPSFGTDPATVNAANLDGKVDPLATEFNGNIENSNIKAGAAIAYAKLNLTGGILNTDINASADIADSKLDTISTAGKVTGAAITGLANVPSGAGAIPIANLSALSSGVINFIIDGGGEAISTGIKGDIYIPFACTLSAWTILADQSGAIKIDIWKDSYANFPPDNDDSITDGKEPEIAASATKAQDTDIADWSGEAITAGDSLRINVDSCTTITRCVLALNYTRT
jgi:hypothetical protein